MPKVKVDPAPQANPSATQVMLDVTFDSGPIQTFKVAFGSPLILDVPEGAKTVVASENELSPRGPSPESPLSAVLTLPEPPPVLVAPGAPSVTLVPDPDPLVAPDAPAVSVSA